LAVFAIKDSAKGFTGHQFWFTLHQSAPTLRTMSTITAIVDPDANGTIRLCLPSELRNGPVRVEARVESVAPKTPKFGCLAGKIWMSPDFDAPLDEFRDYMQ
jgi:hypothetical protein